MPILGEIKRARELGYKGGSKKYVWHACEDCGKERWVADGNLRRGVALICLPCQRTLQWQAGSLRHKEKQMENNPNWRGGKRWRPDGYVEVKLAADDFFRPMAHKRTGYILEHRLVMAQHLKRYLLPWEIVHHKSGIRDDNRLVNLALIGTSGEHNTALNKRIKELERIVAKQTVEIKMLQFRANEVNNVSQVF